MKFEITLSFLLISYFTFAQSLKWEKVDDFSTKPLAIAGDSTYG